jgi:hypothetical protein
MVNIENAKKYGTEAKVKAASLAAFVLGLIVNGFLAGTATDFVHDLPDWLEVAGLGAIQGAGVFVAGWVKANTGALSPSTYEKVEAYLRSKGVLR